MNNNQAVLIKSDCLKIEENLFLLVLFVYHTDKDNKENNFYRCFVRVDTKSFWENLIERLKENNPAELFNMKSLGLETDYLLKGYRNFTNYSFARWLTMKFSGHKVHTVEEFLHGHRQTKKKYSRTYTKGAFEVKLPYVKLYHYKDRVLNLESPYNFPRGLWLSENWLAPPRKKPKIIKD